MDNALTLTNDMKLVLGLVGFTMAMFLFERIRADLVALVVLVVLGISGLVAPEEIFSGFSGNAVMSIIATMVLGAGLDRTGALNRLAAWLLRRGHGKDRRLLAMTSLVAGLNSSFMQNPSVMSLYLPVAARLSARSGLSMSRLLLPLAAAIVMGAALTMVGNSPLILLNDLLVSANNNLPSGMATLEQLPMFAPAPVGLVLLAACLLPYIYRMSGWLYLVAALVLNAGFIGYAFKLWRHYSDALARKTFRFSLIHLSLLFAALLVDHYLV